MKNKITRKVPLNIDYESLFREIKRNPLSKKELIDSVYLVLSFVYPKGNYKHRFRKTNGFAYPNH